MRKYVYLTLTVILLASSCRKELDFDYRSTDKLYVVDGQLSNETMKILITRTRDMDDRDKGRGVEVISVDVTDQRGVKETFYYYSDANYYPRTSTFAPEPGKTYTLTVTTNEGQFTSQSTMHGPVSLEDVAFRYQTIMEYDMLILSFSVRDIPGEDNYYRSVIYLNGEKYRWNVFKDTGMDGKLINVQALCPYDKDGTIDRGEVIREGDNIRLEVHTIDRRAYDYLYSLSLSESTASNPIENFSGGCLGYFAAYSVVSHDMIFRFEDVQ